MEKKLADVPPEDLQAAYKKFNLIFVKNPYDVGSKKELIEHLDKVINREKYKLLRYQRSDKSRAGTTTHRSAAESKSEEAPENG